MEVLQVDTVHLYPQENAADHHTKNFEVLYEEENSTAILRRGQPIKAVVRFNREFDPQADLVQFVFALGDTPHAMRGTLGSTFLRQEVADTSTWSARFEDLIGTDVMLELTTPADTPVGSWALTVVTRLKGSPARALYEHTADIYILFNPWNKADQVYMDDEGLLDEYVSNDVGKVWVGPMKTCRGRHWVFGQFDAVVLPACMLMLDRAEIPFAQRGNPVKVARTVSRIVNSNDDQGVLVGRWDGEYDDGTAPAAWTGSVEILRQFLETQAEVSYGQCWVFAGVVTTVCRALGIPSRVVSNLVSAHDANASLTVDKYYDEGMEELEVDPNNPSGGNDSIWNYHVWNDVWMARPDLPKGYGGWQAVDATPQEASSGFFQCGPAPVEAVKQGIVGLGYDVDFMLASVNADMMRWKRDEEADMGYVRVDCNKYHIGRQILTKKPFVFDPKGESDREEITSLYKYPEGTDSERLSLYNGVRGTERAKRFYALPDASKSDVSFDLIELETVNIGDPFNVIVDIKNNSNEIRHVSAALRASSVFYNGISAHAVHRAEGTFEVAPDASEQINLFVSPEQYLPKLVEYCNMKFRAACSVKETGQVWAEEDDFQIVKPNIDVKINSDVVVGEEAVAEVSFVNPLTVRLTECEFAVAGPGFLPRALRLPHEDAEPGAKLFAIVPFTVQRAGKFQLVVTFKSRELLDMTGAATVEVFQD